MFWFDNVFNTIYCDKISAKSAVIDVYFYFEELPNDGERRTNEVLKNVSLKSSAVDINSRIRCNL